MAVELCSDNNSTGISPRISFSHDLCLSDIVPVERHALRSNSSLGSIDFDFCVRKSFDQESSSADELFSNGKILATEIKKKTKQNNHSSHHPHPEGEETSSNDNNNTSKKEKKVGSEEGKENIIKQSNSSSSNNNSKSFWRFKRSSSLNCVSGYGRSLCPLPLLSRSNSTGSTTPTGVKRVPLSKDTASNHKHNKQALLWKPQSSSTGHQKPPLKKNYGSYGNGNVRVNPVMNVNPVLNVPSGNLFGLGSIFGKEKNYKKK